MFLIINFILQAKFHLILSNKYNSIVKSFGLTQDLSNKDYFLVIDKMDMDLRKYLSQNYNKLIWKQKINIAYEIIEAIYKIHKENAIHKDLHSGNILYLQDYGYWYISDFGFCGPADKPLGSIYGNLPYIAPEVIFGKEYTMASDIYSIGMLMWEISSGQSPFSVFDHDYDLAMKIINGMRPKVIPETPIEYKKLMKQCWDADPLKRPDVRTLRNEIGKIRKLYFQNENDQINNSISTDNIKLIKSNSINLLSKKLGKIYNFEDLFGPRNATKGKVFILFLY